MKSKENCSLCNESIQVKYVPMEDWKIVGNLCGKCYSKKISEHYPGKHVRVNLSDD